ncbi:MAG TPA: hypothetical protein VK672_02205 [Solirubrobacteraceae bacterium]|jgi:hypothetical protein|nr:hypothetical protein [Solirubrobacteraceae bacterium]
MFYVISPPDHSDWQFPRDRLIERLQHDWAGATIRGPDGNEATRDVVWSYASPEGQLEGSQDRAGRVQYLNGPVSLIAEYALWWRHQVAEEQPLILYDESYTTVIPLTEGLSKEQVISALQGSPAV